MGLKEIVITILIVVVLLFASAAYPSYKAWVNAKFKKWSKWNKGE